MDLKRVAAIIHEKREASGIPPAVLARKAGVGRTTLWILERGENPKTGKPSRPAKDLLERLGTVLCLTPAELDELLDLAGYTPRRPDAAAAQAAPTSAPASAPQQQGATIKDFVDAMLALHRQLAEDFRAELRQVVREFAREQPSPFPRYYPAITLDRFWYVLVANATQTALLREFAQSPVSVTGYHFFEMYFWPPLRRAMAASGQWLPRAVRTVASFQAILGAYLQEMPQRRHEYDALIERLSARLDDFDHVYAAAQQVAVTIPERSLAPQHTSTNQFHLALRPSGAIDFVFHSLLTLARGDFSEHTLTLVPANDETRAALILLCLAHAPLLAAQSDDPRQQALWSLSAIKTVEEGLLNATLDRWWEPPVAFERIRSDLERAFPERDVSAERLLAQVRETILRLTASRELSGQVLLDLLTHFSATSLARSDIRLGL